MLHSFEVSKTEFAGNHLILTAQVRAGKAKGLP